MQLAGNGSTPTDLRWSLDRHGPETASVTLVSVSIWVYRALMLAWSLWLALRLLDWLRWGWRGFAEPILWRKIRPGPGKHAGLDADHEEELRLDV